MALKIEDFRNPTFDRKKVVRRKVYTRKAEGEDAFEGSTNTDDFNQVGFTYFLADGELSVVNTSNEQLYRGKIETAEDFEKALKKADKKIRRLRK